MSKQCTYSYSHTVVIHGGKAFKTLAIIAKLKTVILQTPEPRQREKKHNHTHA